MAQFEIKRFGPERHVSLLLPEAVGAVSRGTPLMRDTTTYTSAALASGRFMGFITRDAIVGGPVAADRAQLWPGRQELPFTVGGQVSVEVADAFEAEGDFVLTSGTGALSAETTIGTLLSFSAGKVYAKQSGDLQAPYYLAAILTAETEGNVRILAERCL